MAKGPRAGGQFNIQGIHYQLVRSLLHATRILELRQRDDHEAIRYLLVLEPADGGDLRLEGLDWVEVEQTKIRTQRPWGLAEVISNVLPDLYKAFLAGPRRPPVREARFVTDGKRGRWKAAEEFFGELQANDCQPEALDDTTVLRVTAPKLKASMSEAGLRLTKRGLFHHIASALTGTEKPGPNEQCTVWSFLGIFRFEHVRCPPPG